MKIIDKLTMIFIAVNDMPKAKTFYSEKLGLKVTKDYRRDDANWWVELLLADGVSITLTTSHERTKAGTMVIHFATSDVAAANKALSDKGVKVNQVKDDLHGPGSHVKWFDFEDPDGNSLVIEQA